MPTTRTRRRRQPTIPPDAISSLRAGTSLKYSEENRQQLLSAVYFGDYSIPAAEMSRAVALLAEWREHYLQSFVAHTAP